MKESIETLSLEEFRRNSVRISADYSLKQAVNFVASLKSIPIDSVGFAIIDYVNTRVLPVVYSEGIWSAEGYSNISGTSLLGYDINAYPQISMK